MLFDPKWEVQAKPDVSLNGFIGWLETKDPRAKYKFYECSGRCLLGQYMAEMGIEWRGAPYRPNGDWSNSTYVEVARQIFGRDAKFNVLADRPHTFGAALTRARKALAQ